MSKAKVTAIVKIKKEANKDKYNRPIFIYIIVDKIQIVLSIKEIELIKDGLVYTKKKLIGLTTCKKLSNNNILTIENKDYRIETVDNSTRLSVIELQEVI